MWLKKPRVFPPPDIRHPSGPCLDWCHVKTVVRRWHKGDRWVVGTEKIFLSEERQLKALRFLEENPDISQRQLAVELGISLGAANYCLRALVEKGWVKLENFQKNPRKVGYLYLLTPAGISAKTRLTKGFLKRKLAEYESLKKEIAELQADIPNEHSRNSTR